MSKYDKIMLDTAQLWAKQSYCKRRQVGCVIAKDNRIISVGYNGTIANTPNECEERVVEIKCGNKIIKIPINEIMKCPIGDNKYRIEKSCNGKIYTYDIEFLNKRPFVTNEFTLHAEQNALMFCAKEGISVKDCTMYITHSPCKQCSKLIAQSGIKRVVYAKEYRDTDGIKLLKDIGIEIEHYINEI